MIQRTDFVNVTMINSPMTYVVTHASGTEFTDSITTCIELVTRSQYWNHCLKDASIYNRVTGAIYRVGFLGSIHKIK